MAKIDITRTELVWPGKYNEDGTLKEVPRVSLPFQVIETVNESRATREAKKGGVQGTLFDVYEGKEGDTFEAGWRNKLIWGDNLLVMGSLLEKFAGKIDLIYIDPPFATGTDFSFTAEIGEAGLEIEKDQSAIEEKAYRDTWGKYGPGREVDSWLEMIAPRLRLMYDLLSERGSMLVHVDYRAASSVRFVLEECFGSDGFKNDIVWYYRRWTAPSRFFQRYHDYILWFTKSPTYIFNEQWEEPTNVKKGRRESYERDEEGRLFRWQSLHGERYKIYRDDRGVRMGDVWEIAFIHPSGHERTGYATQKPEALLNRIVQACSDENSIVADFFCGAGTTLAVAEKLGRRWLGADLGRYAVHTSRKRLLGIENCKPFEVLNLGKYERQYWQGVTFGEAKGKPLAEQTLYEYLTFILKLYGAQPVAGMVHLHGKKGKAMVYIGAVDAPVTIAEIDAAVDECAKLKQGELHVLGWEWETGLANLLMVEEAKRQGVKLLLLNIPREVMEQQAVDKGDIKFFEVAHLEVAITKAKGRKVTVTLKDFAFPYADLIPDKVRSKIKKWSDYIDYWAVDWSFQNDTFMNGWVAYRTRKERKLALESDPHVYEKPGNYTLMVKVIDIFGNDTSRLVRWKTKGVFPYFFCQREAKMPKAAGRP